MELFTQPLTLKSVVFTGTNTIGPKVILTVPRMLLIPTKGLELVSDKFGDMTFDGEILVDVTTGSFGTLTISGEAATPSPNNYVVGGGTMTVEGTDIGNVTNVVLTPDIKTLQHFTMRFGEKTLDDVVIIQRGGKLSFTSDEWTTSNLMNYLLGV